MSSCPLTPFSRDCVRMCDFIIANSSGCNYFLGPHNTSPCRIETLSTNWCTMHGIMAGVCQQLLGLNNLFDDSSQALSLVHRLNCLPHTKQDLKRLLPHLLQGWAFCWRRGRWWVVPTSGGEGTGQKSIIKEQLVRLTAWCERIGNKIPIRLFRLQIGNNEREELAAKCK